jgi:hypothetical protein
MNISWLLGDRDGPTYHVILSAAKDLCAQRVRPFAALRVTIDGTPPDDRGGRLENLLT